MYELLFFFFLQVKSFTYIFGFPHFCFPTIKDTWFWEQSLFFFGEPMVWISIKNFANKVPSTIYFWILKNEAGKMTSDTYLCGLVSIPHPLQSHSAAPPPHCGAPPPHCGAPPPHCSVYWLTGWWAADAVLGTRNTEAGVRGVSDNTLWWLLQYIVIKGNGTTEGSGNNLTYL